MVATAIPPFRARLARLGRFRFGIRSSGLTILRMSSDSPAAPASSPVGPDAVRKVAELARLRLPEEDLPAWTEQLGRILSYIGQLEQVAGASTAGSDSLPATPLREDRDEPGGGAEALARNAPSLVHGYGSVPRVVGSSS